MKLIRTHIPESGLARVTDFDDWFRNPFAGVPALSRLFDWESAFGKPSQLFYKELGMADQRQPGLWRASITRSDRRPCIASKTNGKEILSIVTPLDTASDDAAGEAAKAVIKKL